jgi:hypothetical protein
MFVFSVSVPARCPLQFCLLSSPGRLSLVSVRHLSRHGCVFCALHFPGLQKKNWRMEAPSKPLLVVFPAATRTFGLILVSSGLPAFRNNSCQLLWFARFLAVFFFPSFSCGLFSSCCSSGAANQNAPQFLSSAISRPMFYSQAAVDELSRSGACYARCSLCITRKYDMGYNGRHDQFIAWLAILVIFIMTTAPIQRFSSPNSPAVGVSNE